MARFRGLNALSFPSALNNTSFMSGCAAYFRLFQHVVSSFSSFQQHVPLTHFVNRSQFSCAFNSAFCIPSPYRAAAGSEEVHWLRTAFYSSFKPLSFPADLSNSSHALRWLKRGEADQSHSLKFLSRAWVSRSASALYSSSSVSNSVSGSHSRVSKNSYKAGLSARRRRYNPLHANKPSSSFESATQQQELPFEYQYSYSEIPKVAPIGFREPPYSPFGPSTLSQPWTGRPALPKGKKKGKEIDSFNPPPPGKKGVKPVDPPGPFLPGQSPRFARTREEILGEPLTKEEVNELVESCNHESRQINIGRDGLTHNMIEVIHLHWKRRRAIKIRCKGVPTVDMDNVCFHVEDKTGGKIIHRVGGTIHLFRGRNYNTRFRPKLPLMLWKPAAPIYPRLISRIPEGLTKESAIEMRKRGRKVKPLCKLARNGVYLNLVKDVKEAFEVDELVRIDCKGMNPSDYKKIGAKLRDMVPCTLISFEREQILMWGGKDWKPLLTTNADSSAENALAKNMLNFSATSTTPEELHNGSNDSESEPKEHDSDVATSRKISADAAELDKLWEQALDSGAASLLDENGDADKASEGAHILALSSRDIPTETIVDPTQNSAASPNALPVEELAKLLAS